MKIRTLPAIITAVTALYCNPPSREIKAGRESTTVPAQQNAEAGIERRLTLTELIAKEELTKEEFQNLVTEVNTFSDLETIFKTRKLEYPPAETERKEYALTLAYGAPWITHNRRYGVCDEFAMYALPFLLHIPEVENLTLVEISGTFIENNSIKTDALHALNIFQDRTKQWRYFSNGDISKQGYSSQKEAIDAAAKETGYRLEDGLTYKLKGVNSLGTWVYDNNAAASLRPQNEICLE